MFFVLPFLLFLLGFETPACCCGLGHGARVGVGAADADAVALYNITLRSCLSNVSRGRYGNLEAQSRGTRSLERASHDRCDLGA